MLWTTIGILSVLGLYLLVQARGIHLERDAQRRAAAKAEKLSYGEGRPVQTSRNAARRTHAVRDGRHYDAGGNELDPVTGYLLADALLGNDRIEDQRKGRDPEDIHDILQDVPAATRDTPHETHETHEPETPAHTAAAHTPDPTPMHTPDPTPADNGWSPGGSGGYDDGGGWDSDGGGGDW